MRVAHNLHNYSHKPKTFRVPVDSTMHTHEIPPTTAECISVLYICELGADMGLPHCYQGRS